MDDVLPPMPPSDMGAMEQNHYDSYYKYKARDFWKNAEITRIVDKPMKKCTHEFERTQSGVKCKKCNFGLIGFFEVRGGYLYIEGKKVNF